MAAKSKKKYGSPEMKKILRKRIEKERAAKEAKSKEIPKTEGFSVEGGN